MGRKKKQRKQFSYLSAKERYEMAKYYIRRIRKKYPNWKVKAKHFKFIDNAEDQIKRLRYYREVDKYGFEPVKARRYKKNLINALWKSDGDFNTIHILVARIKVMSPSTLREYLDFVARVDPASFNILENLYQIYPMEKISIDAIIRNLNDLLNDFYELRREGKI